MNVESLEAVEPDIEIIVRIGKHEIVVIGIFQNKSDVWDVVVGIDDIGNLDGAISALSLAIAALPSATFGVVRSTGVQ